MSNAIIASYRGDEAHGWYVVNAAKVLELLGMGSKDFSPWSYRKHEQTQTSYALEEDFDFPLLRKAAQKKGVAVIVTDPMKPQAGRSPIRDWPSINDITLDEWRAIRDRVVERHA